MSLFPRETLKHILDSRNVSDSLRHKKFRDKETRPIAEFLGLDLKKYPLKRWTYAMNVELEHGYKFAHKYFTNVTDNDPLKTGMIALAHIVEFPDYYERLEKMEKEGDRYWKNRKRPKIFKNNKEQVQILEDLLSGF